LRRLRQELEYVSRQRDILKKPAAEAAGGTRGGRKWASLVSGDAAARFTLMETLGCEYPTDALAAVLEVSESGFAAHRRKAERPRRRQDAELRPLIVQSFENSHHTYGSAHPARSGRSRAALRQEPHRPADARERPAPQAETPLRPRTTDSRHGPLANASSNAFTCMAVQPDGRILVGGYSVEPNQFGNLDYHSLLIRLNANRAIDNTFTNDNGTFGNRTPGFPRGIRHRHQHELEWRHQAQCPWQYRWKSSEPWTAVSFRALVCRALKLWWRLSPCKRMGSYSWAAQVWAMATEMPSRG
jgi:hypothetical protein